MKFITPSLNFESVRIIITESLNNFIKEYYRKPTSIIFWISLNLKKHLILSKLISATGVSNNLFIHDRVKYKYLKSTYLAGYFSKDKNIDVAINNYQFFLKVFKANFLKNIALKRQLLVSRKFQDIEFSINLVFPYFYNFDGDLCLSICTAQGDVYMLTFSFSPGSVFNCPDQHVLFISGIQGINGKIAEIRKITELCNNVSPAHLLFFTAEALALAAGLKTIIGIGNINNVISSNDIRRIRSTFNYDEFWLNIIGEENPADFYCINLPHVGKPIESVQAKHRSRARKRRELRSVIRNEIVSESTEIIKAKLLLNNS